MKEIENVFIYFVAKRKSPEGIWYYYCLNNDMTIHQCYRYEDLLDIQIENLFHTYKKKELLDTLSHKRYQVKDEVDGLYNLRSVILDFECHYINVKLSYFEEDLWH